MHVNTWQELDCEVLDVEMHAGDQIPQSFKTLSTFSSLNACIFHVECHGLHHILGM